MSFKIIVDTEWILNKSTSMEHRGIRDYEKSIAFDRELDKVELEAICKSLAEDKNCPGWTGVRARKLDTGETNHIYRFYTCYDSSD